MRKSSHVTPAERSRNLKWDFEAKRFISELTKKIDNKGRYQLPKEYIIPTGTALKKHV